MKHAILGALIIWVGICAEAQAGDSLPSSATESELVAAYALNFSRFVDWTHSKRKKSPKEKIRIAIVDNEGIFNEIRKLSKGGKVGDWSVEVESLSSEFLKPDSWDMAVLIPKERKLTEVALKKLKDCQCLTVTYLEGMAHLGAIVNFFVEDGRLRFEINQNRAQAEGLVLSSQLLRLGKIVE